MRYQIRKARTSQLSIITELDRRIFSADDPVVLKNAVWWIVYQKTRPVGFAGLAINVDHGFFRRAGLLRKAKGKGLHRRMISVRQRYLRKTALSVGFTFTADWNHRSINNLILAGFRLYKPKRRYSGMKNAVYLAWHTDCQKSY